MERWTDDEILKLVQLYSQFSNLWDRNEPSYDDLPSRYYSYSRILQGLCMPEHVTVSDVLSKLRELRKIYVSELRRMDVAFANRKTCRPGVVWFETMHCFLYNHLDTDERLARSSNISIHSRGSSSINHSWDICSSEGMSQYHEKEEKSEIFQENSSDQPRAQRGHIFFLRAPGNLRLTRMNTVYEIPKRQGRELDSEKKSDNSRCIQCNVFSQEPNREGKARRHVASRNTLGIKCRDKFRAENLDKDQLPFGVSKLKNEQRLYRQTSRAPCRNEGQFKCLYCQERKKDVRMNRVIKDCISEAKKSLSNIHRQRAELDENFVSRTMQKKEDFVTQDTKNLLCVSGSDYENLENVIKSHKDVTKIICSGDEIEDDPSTILNDATIKLCPVDITCNSDALRWACCKTCSEPTKAVKLPKAPRRVQQSQPDGVSESTTRINLHRSESLSHEMNRCDDKEIEGACTKDKWTDRKLRKLVSLYRNYPCLWQKDAKAYLDNRARHCAYRSIHNAMSPLECTFIEVMMKIRELRRMYVTELKKCLQAETMNCYYDSGCTWFHILHEFLYPYLDYDEAAELHDIPRISLCSNLQRGYKKRSDDEDSLDFSDARERTHKKIKNKNSDNDNFQLKIDRHLESNIPKNIPAGNLRESPTRIIECKTKKQEAQGPLTYCDSVEPRKSISLTILYDKKSEYYSKGGSSATDQEVSWTAESTYKKPNLSAVREPSADKAEVKSRIEAEDEFDIFSRSVACQLKKMERTTALRAQMEIQKILTERLIGPQTATETAISTSKILVPRKVDSRRYGNPPNTIIKRNRNERTNKNSPKPISTFKSTAAQFQQSLQRKPAEGNRWERTGTKRVPITSVGPTGRDRK